VQGRRLAECAGSRRLAQHLELMAETWIELKDADVFAPDNAERLTIAQFKGRDDLGDICSEITEQIRQAYILTGRELGPDGTIPTGLKARAVVLAQWRFISEGVPKYPAIQTKSREAAAREAREYIDQIARADIGIATTPSVGHRSKRYQPRQQDGI